MVALRTGGTDEVRSSSRRAAHRVVVGVDGSAASAAALEHGRVEAQLRGGEIEVVWVWGEEDRPSRSPVDDRARADSRTATWAASAQGPPVPVRVTALRGDAGPTLVEVARDADLLVVGAHGRTGHHWRRLGVVTAGAIVTAVPPVMVVRAAPQAAALDAPIVVGVDGSECSRRALRWALSEASRRGTRVLAVHGWEPPLSSLVDPVPVALHTVDARRRGAEELLDDELARVAAFAPRVPREPLAVRHPGGKAILGARAETGAGLVVVGRHAGPAGTVHALGSVSRHVLGWCPAPVVAVR